MSLHSVLQHFEQFGRTCKELEQFSNAKQWVDVCKAWNEGESQHVSV